MLLALLFAFGPPPVIHGSDTPPSYRCKVAGCVNRPPSDKAGDTFSAADVGARPDGGAVAPVLNTTLGIHKGKVSFPGGSSCYNLGTTGLSITSSDRWLDGDGYGSPGAGPTCFDYTGSGCAITVESAQRVHLSNFDIRVNSASSTAACLCYKATTLNPEFPIVENVSCTNVGTQRLAGQVGLWLNDTGSGIYWGLFRKMIFRGWDTAILLQGGSVQGVNDNDFAELMSYGHNLAWHAIGAGVGQGNVSDNTVKGLKCSRSDGTFVGTSTCMLWGDDGSVAFGNEIKGVVNDSVSPSVCGSFGANTGANSFEGSCESGGGFADNQAAVTSPLNISTFPNDVKNRISLGSIANLHKMGGLQTTKTATIIGQSFFGRTGGPTGTGAGDIVQIGGGPSGGSGLNGGDLQLLGGTGLGQTNGGGGNVDIKPGTRAGTGQGGAVVVGPPAGLSANSGVKVRSGRVTKYTKPFAVSDCAGTNPAPTVSLLVEGSRFSCGTAQTLTTPTAQGASGIVQTMVATSAAPVSVGECFNFTMISTAAANFTLAAGTGVTILGNAVVNNAKKEWEMCVTSTTTNTETVVVY